ncbi:Transcription factor myb3r-5 [Basidiobolus ranarum]|uniref:Transcription factor myb3r-5 n=1 Tax=Basidiobolus ranarum TaxID=34480 RepID=A0ABR2WQB0_9FUNG
MLVSRSNFLSKIHPHSAVNLTRTGSRFFSSSPVVRILNWTPEENERLIQSVAKLGEKWASVAKEFPHRKLQTLRYHYTVKLKPSLSNPDIKSVAIEDNNKTSSAFHKWTPKEDERLLKLVKKYGFSWSLIQQAGFPTHTGGQLRYRYFQGLGPSVTSDVWNLALDELLVKAIQNVGFDNWAEISKLVKGKSGESCQKRWKLLKREAATWKKSTEQSGCEMQI